MLKIDIVTICLDRYISFPIIILVLYFYLSAMENTYTQTIINISLHAYYNYVDGEKKMDFNNTYHMNLINQINFL